MVVTPSTTMASADFCLTAQISPDKVRYLSPKPRRVYIEPLWSFSGVTVSGQLTPRSMPSTRFLSIRSGVCSPASSPRPLSRDAVAFGSWFVGPTSTAVFHRLDIAHAGRTKQGPAQCGGAPCFGPSLDKGDLRRPGAPSLPGHWDGVVPCGYSHPCIVVAVVGGGLGFCQRESG